MDFNFRKSVNLLNFFAEKEGGRINRMKAIKLIWLSDRLHARKYGRKISKDSYYAMPFGPIASGIKDISDGNINSDEKIAYKKEFIEKVNNYEYITRKATDKKVFSKTDLEILEAVYAEFGKLDKFELSKISHDFPEWKKHEETLKHQRVIKIDEMDFFQDPEGGKYHFFDESPEHLEDVKKVFKELSAANK